jgi:hypothetical protein
VHFLSTWYSGLCLTYLLSRCERYVTVPYGTSLVRLICTDGGARYGKVLAVNTVRVSHRTLPVPVRGCGYRDVLAQYGTGTLPVGLTCVVMIVLMYGTL